MNLRSIKLKNIRSYESEEIIFPEGSTLLSGDIGSGKTSILLAIEFAFFGLQPGQRGSALLANGKEQGSVNLQFELDGKIIEIERTLKRGSKTVTQDFAAISIGGVKNVTSVTELKTKVLELLNYPAEFVKKTNLLYRYTVYTPQEEMKQIILEDPETRLNILRHIFGIEKYKRIRENLLLFTSKLREESRILQVELKNLEDNKAKLETHKTKVKSLETHVGEKNNILKIKRDERIFIEKSISDIEGKIKQKQEFEKEFEKTILVLSNKREQLDNEEKNIEELQTQVKETETLFDEQIYFRTVEELSKTQIEIEKLQRNMIELSGNINSLHMKSQEDLKKKERLFAIDICPTCLQDVSETHKHNILNETESNIAKSNASIKQYNEHLEVTRNSLQNQKLRLNEYQDKKNQLEILKARKSELSNVIERINRLLKSKETLEKDIAFLEKHLETLRASVEEFSQYDLLYKNKQKELRNAFQSEKEIEIAIAELSKELEIIVADIFDLEKRISELEMTKLRLFHILDLEKWLSSDFSSLIAFTERNILIKLREEFSKLFNKWFSMLTTDAFFVHLDENFTPIITQGDFELDYAYLSGGERTAVALAYRLALNQIINSLLSKIKTRNLVILDEPTDGFSDQQLDKVRDILHELNVGQLILVSHEHKIEGFVDNIIRLKKEDGISKKE